MKRRNDPGDDVSAWYGSPWSSEPEPPPPPPTPPDDLHKTGPRAASAPKDAAALARVGVVVGRFLPVHAGHVHLVERAFEQCGLLYVLSPQRPVKPYDNDRGGPNAGALHERMMSAAFRELAIVSVMSPHSSTATTNPADPAFAEAWAAAVKAAAPNATSLFSSDDGGGADSLAKALRIEHILVDPRRNAFRISGADIRANLYERFRWIPPAARPLLTLQVAIVGAEGAGKTTLARELATIFEASVVEDSLRMEAERAGAVPPPQAFEVSMLSAAGERENAARASTSGVVVCDDSALSTCAWTLRLGVSVSHRAVAEASNENVDLWLYCHNDFPFQGPPERDDPRGRKEIEQHLDRELAKPFRERRMVHVRGEGADRVDVAADAIRAALAEKQAHLVRLLS